MRRWLRLPEKAPQPPSIMMRDMRVLVAELRAYVEAGRAQAVGEIWMVLDAWWAPGQLAVLCIVILGWLSRRLPEALFAVWVLVGLGFT